MKKSKAMEKKKEIKIANILRNIARYTLLVLGILVFIFALFSGSQGGITGIIKNSPNALPWLILLVLIFIAWKWELVGGIIISFLGIALECFFYFRGIHLLSTFILMLLITILGFFFILSWYLRKDRS